jgi:hypothetical protein
MTKLNLKSFVTKSELRGALQLVYGISTLLLNVLQNSVVLFGLHYIPDLLSGECR